MFYNFQLGTLFSFIGAVLLAYSTFKKNKKGMAKIQIFNPIFGVLSNFFFCSYSAAITNVVNTTRNYLMYKGKLTKKITILCMLFYIVFGLIFNTRGLIGIFPILGSAEYAIFCLKGKSSQSLRYGLLINQVLWAIHDSYIMAFPSLISEIIISSVIIYNIIRFKKKGIE